MGIDFIDTIVVRSANKGTSTISGPTAPSEFMGQQNKTNEEKRLKLAGDLMDNERKRYNPNTPL